MAAGPGRETRIDLIRGLSLLLIFAAHCNFGFSLAIQQSRGFADASELFVMMAGMSAALAYGPRGEGGSVPTGRILKRAFRLYAVHVLLVLALAVVVLLPSPLHSASFWITDPGTLAVWQVEPIRQEPGAFLIDALTLTALPADLDILPLYVALLAVLPLMLLLAGRSVKALLFLSAGVWLLAGATHADFANHAQPSGQWYFDPLSWQFVFVLGLSFGMAIKAGRDPFPYRPWLFRFASAFALLSIPANLVLHFTDWGQLLDGQAHALYALFLSKSFCGVLRLLDALAVVYLLWNIELVRRACHLPWLQPVLAAGRHSLPVFATGLVLSTAIQGLIASRIEVPLGLQIVLLLLGCGVQLGIAKAFDRRRTAKAAPAPRPRASAAL